MLHELLLALVGYTGDLIIDGREYNDSLRAEAPLAEEPTFKLAPDISFIQPSDKEVIQRIITLGFYYRELERFAAKSRNLSWIRAPNESPLLTVNESLKAKNMKPSVYRRAIANGIVEVLSVYRSAVLHIEQKMLSDSLPILATVTQGLNKFLILLPPLYDLILEIERDNICGGKLLNLLHKRCHCGVPELQTCIQSFKTMAKTRSEAKFKGLEKTVQEMQEHISSLTKTIAFLVESQAKMVESQSPLEHWIVGKEADGHHQRAEMSSSGRRLLWHGHQVMYNQLASWMVYGILHDQYGEFFVRRQEDRDSESPPDTLEKLAHLSVNNASLADWHLGFHVYLDMLPEYIPMNVAESVLFAGKAIKVLRNPRPTVQYQDASSQQQIPKGSQRTQAFPGKFTFHKDSSVKSILIGEELLPQSEADKIEAMLQDLKESSEFHKRSFETVVDSIKAIAASHLWQLVVVRADLNGHLKALKDYFLLAKGDFFQSFLEESRQLMRLPPRQSTAEADLMVPFQLAAIKTIGEEDKYFSRVSLRMSGIMVKTSQVEFPKEKTYSVADSRVQSGTSLETSIDGWDGIALEYSVDWPLQLFFTQEVLSKYLRIFRYLLRLKRTQMELEKSWASAMHEDHSDFAKRHNEQRRRCRPMWRVREHMAFLIRNLQFYIQVDVVESQWNVLQAHIQSSRDFTELVGCHQEYLSALISQSFLDIGSVSRILDGIMKVCLQFCWKIETLENNESTGELEYIAEEFNKKSNSLYTILRSSRIAGSQRAPFLRRFLLRLNFNSFFEATARGVLNVVRPRPALGVLQ